MCTYSPVDQSHSWNRLRKQSKPEAQRQQQACHAECVCHTLVEHRVSLSQNIRSARNLASSTFWKSPNRDTTSSPGVPKPTEKTIPKIGYINPGELNDVSIFRRGRCANDGGGGILPLVLIRAFAAPHRKPKRNFALGVCRTHGSPFATPCQPPPGNNRSTEYERSVFAARRAQCR